MTEPDDKFDASASLRGYLFEKFVADLLAASGFDDVRLAGRGPDLGYDILASYPAKTPTGKEKPELWAIQVKHRSKSRVSVSDLAHLTGMWQFKDADKALLVTSSNLTSAAKDYVAKFSAQLGGKLEIWDRDVVTSLLAKHPELLEKYRDLVSEFPLSVTGGADPTQMALMDRLSSCHAGKESWREYEDICTSILTECFVPPLKAPRPQARTWTGLERRDALFSLRGIEGGWQQIRDEFGSNFMLCEFKNYSDRFGKDEVNQTRNYLKQTIGRLGIIFSRNGPDTGARKMRNSVFAEEKKVILFFEDEQLKELLRFKCANQQPLDLIQDAIDDFYISYE